MKRSWPDLKCCSRLLPLFSAPGPAGRGGRLCPPHPHHSLSDSQSRQQSSRLEESYMAAWTLGQNRQTIRFSNGPLKIIFHTSEKVFSFFQFLAGFGSFFSECWQSTLSHFSSIKETLAREAERLQSHSICTYLLKCAERVVLSWQRSEIARYMLRVLASSHRPWMQVGTCPKCRLPIVRRSRTVQQLSTSSLYTLMCTAIKISRSICIRTIKSRICCSKDNFAQILCVHAS